MLGREAFKRGFVNVLESEWHLLIIMTIMSFSFREVEVKLLGTPPSAAIIKKGKHGRNLENIQVQSYLMLDYAMAQVQIISD